jgi:hypothetical protein
MDIEDIIDQPNSLSIACGTIIDSNFLPKKEFHMPVITKGFEEVNTGDRVKMVYFTTKKQLEDYWQKKTCGFIDTGLRYQRLTPDGWELLYEDWSKNS